ncbi:MAG: hypothetical protein NTY01_03430 [Verrucomicrobia bacterium]|nr:hypothetical protein [Verrucomicrobiota bacterium]
MKHRASLMLAVLAGLDLCALSASADEYLVICGPLEIRVSDRGVEAVLCRDRFVFGDAFANPRPAVDLQLLTDRWQQLARVADSRCEPCEVLEQSAGRVTFKCLGLMSQSPGLGRWRWTQDWTIEAAGRLSLRYELREEVAPDKPVRNNRIIFIMDRKEVLTTPKEHYGSDTLGKPVTILERGGREVRTTFASGEAAGSTRTPAGIHLSLGERRVALRVSENAAYLQTWNAGWRQAVNVDFAPPQPVVECRVDIDVSTLVESVKPLTVQRIEPRPTPWMTTQIRPLPQPAEPLRFVQCTPAINQWHGGDKLNPDETRKMAVEIAKHFDVVEVYTGWADWQYAIGWGTNATARATADRLSAKLQEWIDVGHACGLRIALSMNFGGGEPGTGPAETRRLPQFQAETFKPDTGEFVKAEGQFDWASSAAREFAYRAWFAAASKITGVDYLFFNEPLHRLIPWYEAPFFSDAALADFRRFCGNPDARFPAKAYARPTPRTDNTARPADWRRWEDWIADVYARQIALQCRAVAEANRGNPRYRGAIWFQNVEWVGPEWGIDLEKICAIPDVRYIVCEYCTDAANPHWKKFRYFAAKHGKHVSSFVNIGGYDAKAPGRVGYEGTDAGFEAACRMGLAENAPMIALYLVDSFYPWSPAFHAKRVRIWDKVMSEYRSRTSR